MNLITSSTTTIATTMEIITPELAELYLSTNTQNRKISKMAVDKLVLDMLADRFLTTHQGIAFDQNNILMDGQHRLLAILKSGTTQKLLVTRGLSNEAQIGMDGGKKRGYSDFLGGRYVHSRQSATRIILATRSLNGIVTLGSLSRAMGVITTSALNEIDQSTSEIIEEFAAASNRAYRNTNIGTGPILAGAVLLGYGEGEDFLYRLENMIGFEKGDPVRALARYQGTKKKVQTASGALLALKTVGALAEKRHVDHFKVTAKEAVNLSNLPNF